MDRKGQAALEFLMTYGWAIFATIIAISAIIYFGVFNPNRFVQEEINVNPPFTAKGALITYDAQEAIGKAYLELYNGAGENLNVTSISITNCGTNNYGPGIVHPVNNATVFRVTCFQITGSGKQFKGDITIKYNRTDSTYELQSTGKLSTTVR